MCLPDQCWSRKWGQHHQNLNKSSISLAHLQFTSGALNCTGVSICATSYYLPRAFDASACGALVSQSDYLIHFVDTNIQIFMSSVRCVLRFSGPVNLMGSCRAPSVYLTTRLLGRFSPLAVNPYCVRSFARSWQLPFLTQRKGEDDRRKYFMIKSPLKNVADPAITPLMWPSRKHAYIILTPLNPTCI